MSEKKYGPYGDELTKRIDAALRALRSGSFVDTGIRKRGTVRDHARIVVRQSHRLILQRCVHNPELSPPKLNGRKSLEAQLVELLRCSVANDRAASKPPREPQGFKMNLIREAVRDNPGKATEPFIYEFIRKRQGGLKDPKAIYPTEGYVHNRCTKMTKLRIWYNPGGGRSSLGFFLSRALYEVWRERGAAAYFEAVDKKAPPLDEE